MVNHQTLRQRPIFPQLIQGVVNMASIATLTKTLFLLILSIAFPLAAHVLPAENTSPETIVERSSSTETTFRFKFENADGTPISKEAASKINVYHHHMNVSAGIGKRQGSPPRAMNQCRPSPFAGGTTTFRRSVCDTQAGPKGVLIACRHQYTIGVQTFVDPTVIRVNCATHEICVDYRVNQPTPMAYCVSHENFVKLAGTWANDGAEHLTGAAMHSPDNQAQLRVTNPDNTAWEDQAALTLLSERCGSHYSNDCATLQTRACLNCWGLTLAPVDINSNTISTRVIFQEQGVNVWLSQMTA